MKKEHSSFRFSSFCLHPSAFASVNVAYGSDGDKHREKKPQETSFHTAAIETLSPAGDITGWTVGFGSLLSDDTDRKDE